MGLRAAAIRSEPSPSSTAAGLTLVLAASLAATIVVAWPVIAAPSERIFGHELVGRHHDPFTVIWRFEHEAPPTPYRQPLVDDVGQVLARVIGSVPAFNAIVLLTFPLSAAAAYALARYLQASHAGAVVAGLAFAFAPFRLAHAAYHPHIVQTQWLALYFLALWACLDRSTIHRCAVLACAVAALALSSLYAAFIAAIVTPVAAASWWAVHGGGARRHCRRLGATVGTLVLAVLVAVGVVAIIAPELLSGANRFAFDRGDLVRDGARWWAYVLPPADHPLLGGIGAAAAARSGIPDALVEQQLALGSGLMVLALIAVWRWARLVRVPHGVWPDAGALRAVPVLLSVAAWAVVCSLAPSSELPVPAAAMYDIAPMFRAYARFGVVAQLMVALLAGAAVTSLFARGVAWPVALRPRVARAAAGVALVATAFEYAPLPWRSRDVLPTAAHRVLAGEPAALRVFDCARQQDDGALPWLMKRELEFLSDSVTRCDAADVPARLAALGFTHMIVRATADAAPWHASMTGLAVTASLHDSLVLTVTAPKAPLVLVRTSGFFPPDPGGAGRWMGQHGSFVVRNTTAAPLAAALELDIVAFAQPRTVTLSLGDERFATLAVPEEGLRHTFASILLPPGDSEVRLEALEAATTADSIERNGDSRGLTLLMRDHRWLHGSGREGVRW